MPRATHLLVALAAALTAFTLLLVSSRTDSALPAETRVQQVDPELAARYGELRRPASTRDALADGPIANRVETAAGANRSLARRLDDGRGRLAMWIVPGRQSLCMVLRLDQATGDTAGTCYALAEGRPDLLMTLSGGKDRSPTLRPNEVIVAGVVPDGVSEVQLTLRSGERRTIGVVDNGFSVDVDGATQSLSYTMADGKIRAQAALSYEG